MTNTIVRATAILLSLLSISHAGEIERTTVFTSGLDGYHTYRIPSVIRTKSGALLAFAEGRKNGGGDSGDIDLLLRRSADDGKTFAPQQMVWDDADNCCGNPCPVVDQKTGRIALLMTHNLGADTEKTIKLRTAKSTRTVWISSSDDDGVTWSPSRDITQQVQTPGVDLVRHRPRRRHSTATRRPRGRIVIPCDYVAPAPAPRRRADRQLPRHLQRRRGHDVEDRRRALPEGI
jgi:sialidase-1